MLGIRLKQLRSEKNLSQKALAELLGTSAGYISEIEKGKKMPGGDFLATLKRTTGVSIDWLLTGDGEIYTDKDGGVDANDTVFYAESIIESQHMKVVKRFKNKAKAKRMNENLADIEDLSPPVFEKIDKYIEDTAEIVRLSTCGGEAGGPVAGDDKKKKAKG